MQYHRCYQVRKKQGESSKDFMKRCADKQRFIEHKMRNYSKKDWCFTVNELESAVVYRVYLTSTFENTEYGRLLKNANKKSA